MLLQHILHHVRLLVGREARVGVQEIFQVIHCKGRAEEAADGRFFNGSSGEVGKGGRGGGRGEMGHDPFFFVLFPFPKGLVPLPQILQIRCRIFFFGFRGVL